MKASFYSICLNCRTFKPRCARVVITDNTHRLWPLQQPVIICEDCRRDMRGQYLLHESHKGGK